MTALAIVAGGVGAVLRFVVDGLLRARWPGRLPWPTAVINVSGSLVLGLLTGLVAAGVPGSWALVLGTGLCGGWTTFSTASFETVRLLQQRRWGAGAGYLLGSLILSIAAAAIGFAVGRGLG
ncbi:fluoride efflux transporter CrcB [Nakamurella leprariae]|uniref:Fluoride-specific ion channel FluC n=1 Tax=Nakamurella leprariae TaxID=2803911 RepID=A0A938YJM5_9ACTN|nr:fluoride efflux transporter CrcB [Nakamurella leprariae]MBM9469083.1 fluoride efflux transporter CrcB [Nakamurella leprariae]